ncbi:MAG: ActS/PrrB/RegB family redox-sensitive histidine kinase [Sneathiellaceae bacterium]
MQAPPDTMAADPVGGPHGLVEDPESAVAMAAGGTSVRLRTLGVIRWVAIVGQALAVLFIHYALGLRLPIDAALGVIGISVLVNLACFLIYPAATRLDHRQAAAHLAFDLVQLAALLYLSGGLENPFSLLILVPVTISATILPLRATLALGLLAVMLQSLLLFVHLPLPWLAPGFALPVLYMIGIWVSLVLGLAFLCIYSWRVAEEARRMSAGLAATQLALAREHRLAALGGLAAAAAHELGTPLGTIVVAAAELRREAASAAPDLQAIREDAELLHAQAGRCRGILAQISARPDDDHGADHMRSLTVGALVEAAAEPHLGPDKDFDLRILDTGPQLVVRRRAEIMHALGNLIENAMDFAASRVTVTVSWTESELQIEVADDGPGFNIDILSALGEPYTTSRPGEGGMGLGVFIAKTLLERTSARIRFANLAAAGGALVSIQWPRAAIEERQPGQPGGAVP